MDTNITTNEYIKNKMYKKKFKDYLPIILIILFFIIGIVIGQSGNIYLYSDSNVGNVANTTNLSNSNQQVINGLDESKYLNVLRLLKSKYYDPTKINDNKAFDGALSGMVSSVGDPYTVYFDKDATSSFNEEMSGSFSGIGAEIGVKDGSLTVIAPLKDTPAEKAGIMAGDIILKINNEDTQGMSSDIAVSKIRGEKGTEVKLTIYRPSDKSTKELSIFRDEIVVQSVDYQKKGNIAVISISSFNDTTSSKFKEVASQIVADKNIKSIILDLRNNPGGYLDTAIDIASYWIRSGVVVQEKDRTNQITKHNAIGDPMLENYPTVVLINQGSASASEILSGALKDYKKATLVGKKTFGKGSVQEYQELGDGTAIKITVAEWLTPNNININKNGIEPDIDIDYTEKDFEKNIDPQLNKAIEILNK